MKIVLSVTWLAVLGCGDFDLVAPDAIDPVLFIAVRVTHDTASVYALDANLDPGRDASGHENIPVSAILYVDGLPLQPTAVQSSRMSAYRWQRVQTPSITRPDSLRISVPIFAPPHEGTLDVTIPIPAREDPVDIALAAGDELRLHLSPAFMPPQFSGGLAFWDLSLRSSCTTTSTDVLRVMGQGSYPNEIRLPWEWIQTSTLNSFEACFRTISVLRLLNAPYAASLYLTLEARWRIQILGQ